MKNVGWQEIAESKIVLGKKIAKGAFGVVYDAEYNGSRVAVKQIASRHPSANQMEMFQRELCFLQ